MPIRYVISHMDGDGFRAMTYHRWGRYTKSTREEAEQDLKDLLTNNTEERLVSIFGTQSAGTFEVSAMECYPNHFDPVGCYIQQELNPGQQILSDEMLELFEELAKLERRNERLKDSTQESR